MPSDDRALVALQALRRPIDSYRAALATALEHARAELASRNAGAEQREAEMRAELGPFGAGHIDAARFATLSAGRRALDPDGRERMACAIDVIRKLLALGDELFLVDLPSGGRLRLAIATALADAGRAFGAATTVELVRRERYRPADHDWLLEPVDFASWTKAERRLAPPLVAVVDGNDLRAGLLSEFLDGTQKIVLVVRGVCSPAPLARLITPGTFVLQTGDATGLDGLAAFDGPGIGAIVPEGAARFVHDPAAGREPWQRLTLHHTPEPPRRALGGLSVWQQGEELRHLLSLATRPAPAEPAMAGAVSGNGLAQGPAGGAPDPADRLASWLLSQVDLRDLA